MSVKDVAVEEANVDSDEAEDRSEVSMGESSSIIMHSIVCASHLSSGICEAICLEHCRCCSSYAGVVRAMGWRDA